MQDNPQALLPKAQLSVVPLPGSRPLSNTRHEHYSRLRLLRCPKGRALREAGMRAVKKHDAVSNATRLERRQDVRDRIAYLVRQEEEVLAEKRKRMRNGCGRSTRPISATSSNAMTRKSPIKMAISKQMKRVRFCAKRASGRSFWRTSPPKRRS
jgi:hypothetical protein